MFHIDFQTQVIDHDKIVDLRLSMNHKRLLQVCLFEYFLIPMYVIEEMFYGKKDSSLHFLNANHDFIVPHKIVTM